MSYTVTFSLVGGGTPLGYIGATLADGSPYITSPIPVGVNSESYASSPVSSGNPINAGSIRPPVNSLIIGVISETGANGSFTWSELGVQEMTGAKYVSGYTTFNGNWMDNNGNFAGVAGAVALPATSDPFSSGFGYYNQSSSGGSSVGVIYHSGLTDPSLGDVMILAVFYGISSLGANPARSVSDTSGWAWHEALNVFSVGVGGNLGVGASIWVATYGTPPRRNRCAEFWG